MPPKPKHKGFNMKTKSNSSANPHRSTDGIRANGGSLRDKVCFHGIIPHLDGLDVGTVRERPTWLIESFQPRLSVETRGCALYEFTRLLTHILTRACQGYDRRCALLERSRKSSKVDNLYSPPGWYTPSFTHGGMQDIFHVKRAWVWFVVRCDYDGRVL